MSLKFISFFKEGQGKRTGAVLEDKIVDITSEIGNELFVIVQDERINNSAFIEKIKAFAKSANSVAAYSQLQEKYDRNLHLLIPYSPPEVWGVGVTYIRNMQLHEDDLREANKSEGLYNYVYTSTRPEIFFKALPHHCVGTHADFTIRKDSDCTIVEAELACIFSKNGDILAFTATNDITAWDIELECPLFLNYAKIFDGGCILGPAIVPASEIKAPRDISVKCTVTRKGEIIFNETGSTKNMKRSFEELTDYMFRSRSVPTGAVLCTGTAVGVPSQLYSVEGDIVEIELEGIGKLINKAKRK